MYRIAHEAGEYAGEAHTHPSDPLWSYLDSFVFGSVEMTALTYGAALVLLFFLLRYTSLSIPGRLMIVVVGLLSIAVVFWQSWSFASAIAIGVGLVVSLFVVVTGLVAQRHASDE